MRLANDACKSVLILGTAASGSAAARLLLSEGKSVRIIDEQNTAEIRRRAAALKKIGAVVTVGAKTVPAGRFDCCVVSPGVRPNSALLRKIAGKGIPVLPEFELGWMRAKSRVLAITGSNGKSTLVKLCVEAIRRAGLSAFAAGNYGPPVSQVVMEHPRADWLVIEVSSFQLETASRFHPDVAVLLNILPNHLDRHRTLGNYGRIKAGLFANMSREDRAIVNEQNLPEVNKCLEGSLPLISFGLSPTADYCFRRNSVRYRNGGRKADFDKTVFANEVLGLTAAAATAAADSCGIPLSCLEKAARKFRVLPHRMEVVGKKKGVRFVDDSKSTNTAALIAALAMTPAPVRLIAGGLPKKESYAPVRGLLRKKATGAYLVGTAAAAMEKAWRGVVPCHLCKTIAKAVQCAWRDASAGDTVLLSPACASFDQFAGFEERGEYFRRLFESLE